MTYQEAVTYLNSFINYEKKTGYDYSQSFRLERMRQISSLLGDPHEGIRSIHVAGTKGKGSTSAIICSILKSAGFKVGLYTSPHLVSFRERIRIGDRLISEEDVARLSQVIKDALSEMSGDDEPSFFEAYTALAYLYFKENKVDFAVYEVGLGGRLDATNIIKPLVSAITPISYEHTQKLGTTLAQIAAEKAGIIKSSGICVSAPQEEESLAVIEKVCRERNSKLILVGRDVFFEDLGYTDGKEIFGVLGSSGEHHILEMSLMGLHQIVNATTAIAVIEGLRFHDITISPSAIRRGIKNARWEGRLEVVREKPLVILDGAQNKASAKALALAIRRGWGAGSSSAAKKYKNLILILGVSKDKDVKGIIEELLPIADSLILTKSMIAERSLEPSSIKKNISSNIKKIILTNSVEEALKASRLKAGEKDLILITGSLFIVGEARQIILGNKELRTVKEYA